MLAINFSQIPLLPQGSLQTFSLVKANIHASHVFLFPNPSLKQAWRGKGIKKHRNLNCDVCSDRSQFAEREGFEPPVPRSTTVFKTAAIDHSAISPMEFPPKSDAKIVYFFIKKKISTIFLSLHNITYPRGDLSYSSLNVPLPFLSIKPYLRL